MDTSDLLNLKLYELYLRSLTISKVFTKLGEHVTRGYQSYGYRENRSS